MNNFLEISYDDWFDTYRPITNHIDKNASFDGYMFETYGDEVEFVKSQDPAKIWMYGDGDSGNGYIWSGWGLVNRLGYFITEVPCPENLTIQIKLDDYYYFCEGCHAEWDGDTGLLINDTLGEIEKCISCATPEEIKQYPELDQITSV